MWLTSKRPDFTVPPTERSRPEAVEAQKRAEQALALARIQSREAQALAGSLHDIRMANHFGESVAAAFARRP